MRFSAVRRAAVAVAVAAAALAVMEPAGAQGTDTAAAQALFVEGRSAAVRGDMATACALFEESQRLEPAPGTLLNLASCEEALGKVASAWAHVLGALDKLPATDERSEVATAMARRLEPRLPKLVVHLAPSAPAATQVRRNDVELGAGALGVSIAVDPGPHTLVATAPGRSARRYPLRIAEGQHVELSVEPGPPIASKSVDLAPRPNRAPGWFMLGGAGVLAATGAVFGALALEQSAIMKDHCDALRRCDQDGLSAARSGHTYDVVSTTTFIAAGLVAAAGLVWILSHPEAAKR